MGSQRMGFVGVEGEGGGVMKGKPVGIEPRV